MNKADFFTHLRKRNSGLFGTSLSQGQVEGCDAILGECRKMRADLAQAAYILATAYGETGGKMQPRRENMSYSAERIRQVWPSRFGSVQEARPYARNPRGLANKVYNGRMGNRTGTDDGWHFRGNGMGQITGRYNHTKWGDNLGIDLLNNPSLMDDLGISVSSLVQPMLDGWATGKRLSQYVSGSHRDYHGARAVWGGVDAAKYAGYARSFQAALEAAGYAPAPVSVLLDYDPAPPKPAPQPAPTGFWAALLALFQSFKKGR